MKFMLAAALAALVTANLIFCGWTLATGRAHILVTFAGDISRVVGGKGDAP